MKINMHITGLDEFRKRLETTRSDLVEQMTLEILKRYAEKSTMSIMARAARQAYRKHLSKMKARRSAGVYFGIN